MIDLQYDRGREQGGAMAMWCTGGNSEICKPKSGAGAVVALACVKVRDGGVSARVAAVHAQPLNR